MKLHLIIGLVLLWTVSASETELDKTSPAEAKDAKDVPIESADDVEERLIKFKKPVPVPVPVPVRNQPNKQVTKLLLVRPVGVIDTVNSPAHTHDDPPASVLSALGNIQSLPIRTAVFKTLLKTGQLGKLTTTPKPPAARPYPTRPYPTAGPSYPNNYKPPTHYPSPSDNKPYPNKPYDNQNQQYNHPDSSKPYPSYPEPNKPYPSYPEPSKPYPSYPEPSKPYPSYPEPSKPYPAGPYDGPQYNYPEPYPNHYQYPAYGNSPNYYPPKLVAIPIETSDTTLNKGSLIDLLGSLGVRTKK